MLHRFLIPLIILLTCLHTVAQDRVPALALHPRASMLEKPATYPWLNGKAHIGILKNIDPIPLPPYVKVIPRRNPYDLTVVKDGKVYASTNYSIAASIPDRSNWAFHMENDAFVPNGTDRYYTGGYHLERTWVSSANMPKIPRWLNDLPVLPRRFIHPTSVTLGLTQTAYTPDEIHDRTTIGPDSRPYAGWLRASATKSRVIQNLDLFGAIEKPWYIPDGKADSLQLSLGFTGEYSFAEKGQKGIHKHLLGDSRTIEGWEDQLNTYPVAQLEYDRLYKYSIIDETLELIPRWGADLGNAFINADARLHLRCGYNLPKNFGAGRVTTLSLPSVPAATPKPKNWSAYLFAEGTAKAVGWNLFLEGDNGIPNHGINTDPFVTQGIVGASVRYKDYELSYQWVVQSEEFEEQEGSQSYGIVTFSWR